MAMLDTIRRWAQRAGLLTAVQWLRGESVADGGVAVTQPMAQSTWVYRCIRDIGDTLSGVPLKLSRPADAAPPTETRQARRRKRWTPVGAYRAAGDEMIEAGPVAEVLAMPSPGVTTSAFVRKTATQMQQDGNVFWVFREAAGTRPTRIDVVPMRLMQPATENGRAGGRITGWVYDPNGEKEPLGLQDVVHLKFDNPYSELWGLGPLDAYRISLQADVSAATWNKTAFDNSAEPGVVLSYPIGLTPEQFKQIREEWNSRHRGAGKAKGVAVLGGGGKVEAFASTHTEMQYLEGRKFSREEASAAFGVPLERLSGLQNSNRATGQVGERAYWMQTLIPLGVLIAEAWTLHVARRFDAAIEAWFDFDSVAVLQEMFREEIDAGAKLALMGFTAAQVNESFDWGFDIRPEQDEVWVPMGQVPARYILEEGAAALTGPSLPEGETEPGPGPQEPSGQPEQQSIRTPKPETRDPKPETRTPDPDPRIKRVWSAWVASWRPLERTAERKLRAFLHRQEGEMLKRLGELSDQLSAVSGPRGTRAEPGLIGRILLDLTTENGKLRAIASRFIDAGVQLGIAQGVDESSVAAEQAEALVASLISQPMTEQVKRRIAAKIVDVNRTTIEACNRTLTEGIEAGEGMNELRKRLQGVFAMTPARSLRIARTEVAASVSAGRQRTFESLGLGKIWTASQDAGTRPAHRQAGIDYASAIPADQPFIVDGEELMHPGDPAGSAGNVINCRCVSLARRVTAAADGGAAQESAEDVLERYVGRRFVQAGDLHDNRSD